jgi:hypothetical protein
LRVGDTGLAIVELESEKVRVLSRFELASEKL